MFAALRSRLRNRTAFDIAGLIVKNVRHGVASVSPDARARRAEDRAFDGRWKTDTSTGVSIHELGFAQDEIAHYRRYDPSSEAMLRDPIASLGIDPTEFAFVDYGAGKGRVVLLAMEMGFLPVTGVELSAPLCRIARSNLAIFGAQNPSLPMARIVEADATTVQPEGRKIVAYFYNPFDAVIMARVRRRLEDALRNGAERVIVIYANPEHGHVFAAADGWTARPSPLGVSIFEIESETSRRWNRTGGAPTADTARA